MGTGPVQMAAAGGHGGRAVPRTPETGRSPSQVPKHSLWPALGPLQPDGSYSAPATLGQPPPGGVPAPKAQLLRESTCTPWPGLRGSQPQAGPLPPPPHSHLAVVGRASGLQALRCHSLQVPNSGLTVAFLFPLLRTCHSPGSNACFLLN